MRTDPSIAELLHAIATILRERRETLQMSKKRLAELAGVSRTAIILTERGDRMPSLELSLRLAHSLDCSLADVIRDAQSRVKKRSKG